MSDYTLPQFQSTANKKLIWRIWHAFNYLLGGSTFLIGSFLYFPYFLNKGINSDLIAGWLYTIGSVGFLLADITEWNHFRIGCFPYVQNSNQSLWGNMKQKQLGINFFASAIGSFFYLLGSIFFIPQTNQLQLGEVLFIVGSTFIYCSQGWKCYRTCFFNTGKTMVQNIKEDASGFFVDLFAGIGGIFYFIGTFIFHLSENVEQDYDKAITLFTCGGASFLLSGIFIFKRYFMEKAKISQISDQLVMSKE